MNEIPAMTWRVATCTGDAEMGSKDGALYSLSILNLARYFYPSVKGITPGGGASELLDGAGKVLARVVADPPHTDNEQLSPRTFTFTFERVADPFKVN